MTSTSIDLPNYQRSRFCPSEHTYCNTCLPLLQKYSVCSYSGSDLRELCRTAAVYRLKELSPQDPDADCDCDEPEELRAITNDDLLAALAKMRESKLHCGMATKGAEAFSLD